MEHHVNDRNSRVVRQCPETLYYQYSCVSSLSFHEDGEWQMLALYPFPSLDVQSIVLSSVFILQYRNRV